MPDTDHPALEPIGWDQGWDATLRALGIDGAVPARVMRHDAALVAVARPEPSSLPVRAGIEQPVVGDWVGVVDGTIVAVLPRTSLLRRRDAIAQAEQALAANLDVLFIVCGLDRPLRTGRLQRATALAWDAGAVPVVVLTKADLVADAETRVAEARAAVPEVEVLVVSTPDGGGIEEVRTVARGRSVVLLGESGAGKSTLVNALIGTEVAITGRVREGDAKGRHTTTTRQLHALPGGGVLLDSPGIRAVGLWVDPDSVDAVFPDIEVLTVDCRFGDCAHQGEPGCAVLAAIKRGDLDEGRLTTWRAMRSEAEAAARSDEERRRREKTGTKSHHAHQRRNRDRRDS